MERNRGMMRSSVTSMALVGLLLLMNGAARAATCSDCHGMPPIDAAYRNITTGGFRGSHQTHQPAVAAPANCESCHTGSSSYAIDHMDGVVKLAANVNNSPLAATYSKGIFFNQTSRPVMGTCASVNCHFEQVTPAWSSAPLTSPGSCNVCHGAAPADGNHPASSGAGKKHGDYYGTTTSSCIRCHPDHTLEAKPFAHASSAGDRSLIVRFSAPNSGGSYSGNITYPSYLPSQNPARNGTCAGFYCHSDGNGGVPAVAAVWGATLPVDCSGCHGGAAGSVRVIATGKHGAHVNNAAALGVNIGCVDCHARTVGSNTAVINVARHVNNFKDYSGVRAGSYASGTGVCANIYCHSDGKGRQNVAFTSANGWRSTATFDCKGCHGSDTNSGSFASAAGEPNYSNSGAGSVRANSHQKHVGLSGTTTCVYCHSATTTNGTSLIGSHADGVINVVQGSAKTFSWTAGTKTCAVISCHGSGSANAVWGATLGCAGCHGGDSASGAPITSGRHAGHINNAAIIGSNFGCAECHAKTVSGNSAISNVANHGNGFVDYSGARAGRGSSYASASGVCSASYCHTDGKGQQKITAANNWKSGATLDCRACHGSDTNGGSFVSVAGEPNYSNAGTGQARANSHLKHVGVTGAPTCVNCHATTTTSGVAVLANTNHLDGALTVVAGNSKSFTWTAASDTCTNISCHGAGSVAARWGATLGCTGCHGGDTGSGTPITTGRHTGHINNAAVLGTNLGCAECHAKTVSGNTSVSNINNHGNGFVDFSGVRAGKSVTYSGTTGVCSATYCHTDGKGLQKMVAANNWRSGTTLDCKGCHGSDPNSGSFVSQYGEPNYSSAGAGALRANSHQKHVSTGPATVCGNCHAATTTTGTSITGTVHLGGTISLAAGNGKTFSWTPATKTCSVNGCHGNATWGGTLGCVNCHNSATIVRTKGRPGETLRNVVAEFASAWSHKRSAGGTVTDADCIVCHLEGVSSTGKTSTLHQDGNIDLRDPDGATAEAAVTNISGAAFTFQRFTSTFVANSRTTTGHLSNNIDNVITQKFCLKCHDANGATNPGARVGGAATSQYKPFNTTITGASYVTPLSAGVAGGVVDVDTQLATTNRSYHPVKGPQNNSYTQGTRMVAPYGVTKTPGTPSNGVVITCFDCHNQAGPVLTRSTVTAHGNAVTLRGIATVSGTPSSTNKVTLCAVCHAGYLGGTASNHGAGSAFTSSTDSGMTSYVNYGCNICHSSGYATAVPRPIRGQDTHGSNTIGSVGTLITATNRWATDPTPIAFIRNRQVLPNHTPKQMGTTVYTPNCMGGNVSPCSQSSKSYSPGGVY